MNALSCSTMLHVFRCLVGWGCTSGLHEACVASCILSVARCNVLKCCASQPAVSRRGTSSRSCTTGRCAPAVPAAPQTTPKPGRTSRSAFSDYQGTQWYHRYPAPTWQAPCGSRLHLRVARCILRGALHAARRGCGGASFGARGRGAPARVRVQPPCPSA